MMMLLLGGVMMAGGRFWGIGERVVMMIPERYLVGMRVWCHLRISRGDETIRTH
jgi:hypothetical protein